VSYRDRDWAADENPMGRFGRPGGDFHGIRPSLDNPMSWALPVGRVAGIAIRVHLIFLIFVVIELLRGAGTSGTLGFTWTLTLLASLFAIVLLHEFGHCLACRFVGGEADEILMWPLGGLAFCRPPHTWQAHLVTAAGGPAVNVVICLAMGTLLFLFTGEFWGVAMPKLFDIGVGWAHVSDSPVLVFVYLTNWVSLVLLLFNLLPIYPLDGGRIVQALLWPRTGYSRSMRYAVRTGYVGAIVLGITGFVLSSVMLVLIAVFGGITCYITSRQLAFTDEFMGYAESEGYAALDDEPPPRATRRERRRRRADERAHREEERVERILSKIADSGIESLTLAERRLLKRATRRRKEDSAGSQR
jgi:Zn-dependent protease